MDERRRGADLWEAGADERERLADERERLADEREGLADARDRLADRQEREQDRRETPRPEDSRATGVDDEAEVAASEAALRRADAAVRRAEAELELRREAADRIRARVMRHAAADARAATAVTAAASTDVDELAWFADRRDFVGADRDSIADMRDRVADRREEIADRRERLADDRERDLLGRERRLDDSQSDRGRTSRTPRRDDGDAAAEWDERAAGQRRRERATVGRRAAAVDRARAAQRWGPQAYGPMLLASFAPVARQMFVDENLSHALADVVKFAVGAVAGCEHASITMYRHGRTVDTVSSDSVAAELDDLQFATDVGPSFDAMHSEDPVNAAELAGSSRWAVLAATAAQLGVASVLSHGLFIHRPAQWSALGALTLYGGVPNAFSDEDQEFGSILSAYVSVAVATAQRREEVDRREAALHRGLSTRDVIGQAKGILMERQRLSAGEAFDLLRRTSQALNRKLAEVAQQLAETGEMPT